MFVDQVEFEFLFVTESHIAYAHGLRREIPNAVILDQVSVENTMCNVLGG